MPYSIPRKSFVSFLSGLGLSSAAYAAFSMQNDENLSYNKLITQVAMTTIASLSVFGIVYCTINNSSFNKTKEEKIVNKTKEEEIVDLIEKILDIKEKKTSFEQSAFYDDLDQLETAETKNAESPNKELETQIDLFHNYLKILYNSKIKPGVQPKAISSLISTGDFNLNNILHCLKKQEPIEKVIRSIKIFNYKAALLGINRVQVLE